MAGSTAAPRLRCSGGIWYECSRRKVKKLNLRVRRDGSVAVSIPLRLDWAQADRFVAEQAQWIAEAQARQLARVVSDVKGKLNLIVYNPSEGDPYKAPSPERVLAFEQYLWDRNITAIIRKSKGQDIKAACGQLKAARQNEAGEQA